MFIVYFKKWILGLKEKVLAEVLQMWWHTKLKILKTVAIRTYVSWRYQKFISQLGCYCKRFALPRCLVKMESSESSKLKVLPWKISIWESQILSDSGYIQRCNNRPRYLSKELTNTLLRCRVTFLKFAATLQEYTITVKSVVYVRCKIFININNCYKHRNWVLEERSI